MKKSTLSVRFPEDVFKAIKERTTVSRRSLNAEIVHLVQIALEQRFKTVEEVMDLLRHGLQQRGPVRDEPVASPPLEMLIPLSHPSA